MDTCSYEAIGQRIRTLRRQKKLSQQDVADMLGKAIRTYQKYETGEIEVSIATVNQLAEILNTTSTYLMGFEPEKVVTPEIKTLADIINALFKLEETSGVKFDINVTRPPRTREWRCGLSFNGKAADAEYNADLCLFLEDWADQLDALHNHPENKEAYQKWQDQTLAYYAATPLSSGVEDKEGEDEPLTE